MSMHSVAPAYPDDPPQPLQVDSIGKLATVVQQLELCWFRVARMPRPKLDSEVSVLVDRPLGTVHRLHYCHQRDQTCHITLSNRH